MTNPLQLRTLIDTKFNDWYAVVFLVFVIYAGVLFVFDLLEPWDPAVMALPIVVSKIIYGLGSVSGLTVLGGMIVGALGFHLRAETKLPIVSLWVQIIGSAFHLIALSALAFSTTIISIINGRLVDVIWILPVSIMLMGPHVGRTLRLIHELTYADYKSQLRIDVHEQAQVKL